MNDYHTALRDPVIYPPARQYEDVQRGHLAIWHDVILGLPLQMFACDVI